MTKRNMSSALLGFFFLFYSAMSLSLSVTDRIQLPSDEDNTQQSYQMPRSLILDDNLLVFYKGNQGKIYYNYATYDTLQDELLWNGNNIKLLAYEKDKPTDIVTQLWPEPAIINNRIYLFRKNDNDIVRHVYVNNFSELTQNYWTKNDATIYEHLRENLTLLTIPSDDPNYGSEMLIAGLQKREEVFASVSQRIEKQHLYFNQDKNAHFEKGKAIEVLSTRNVSYYTIAEPPALLFEDTPGDKKVHYFIPREDGKTWHYQLTGENYNIRTMVSLLHTNSAVTPAALWHNEDLYLLFAQQNGQIAYMIRTKIVNDLGDVSYSWSEMLALEDLSGNNVVAKTNYGISAVNLGDSIYLSYADSTTRDVTLLKLK